MHNIQLHKKATLQSHLAGRLQPHYLQPNMQAQMLIAGMVARKRLMKETATPLLPATTQRTQVHLDSTRDKTP